MEMCFPPIIRCSRFSCRKRKIGKQLFLPHNRFLTGYGGNLSSGNKSTHPLHLRMDSIFVPFPLNGVSFPMAELFPLVYHFISLVYGYPVRYMGTMNFSPVVFLPLFFFSDIRTRDHPVKFVPVGRSSGRWFLPLSTSTSPLGISF